MKALLHSLPVLAALLLVQSGVHAQVTWRVSVKFINDANDNRPTNGTITNDAAVRAQIAFANTLPTFARRGVRLDLIETLDVVGASKWFNKDPANNLVDLEADATADPAKYHWRTDAINIYLNNQSAGGCSFPGVGSIIFLGTSNSEWVFIHEIGHFMSLFHTQNGESFADLDLSNCNIADPDPCVCYRRKLAGEDGIADTLPDNRCWDSRDQIAQGNFNMNWSDLTTNNQINVDNTLHNIMSYHSDRSIFTTLQLDAMCDTSNRERDNVAHNQFVFVDVLNTGISPNGSSKNQPVGGPFKKLKNGIDAAAAGDIVLIRPGSYTEEREIRKAITLRAVRSDVLTPGSATIRAQ